MGISKWPGFLKFSLSSASLSLQWLMPEHRDPVVQVLVVECIIQGLSREMSRILITAITQLQLPISNAKERQIVSEQTTKREVAQSLVENENINTNFGSGLNLKNYRVSVVLLVIPYIYSYSKYLSFIIYSKQINYQLST